MPNSTITTFGYPDSLLAENAHWVVLLRPKQVTIGSVVLACQEEATSLGAISRDAAAALPDAVRSIEEALHASFGPGKFNYLALMMVDPHVHFHVIPRYPEPVELGDRTFADSAWPGPPDVAATLDLSVAEAQELHQRLLRAWPGGDDA